MLYIADKNGHCQSQMPGQGSVDHVRLTACFVASKLLAVVTGCQAKVKRMPLFVGRTAADFYVPDNGTALHIKTGYAHCLSDFQRA